MKLIFFIGHPAQYYLLKNTYNYFKYEGNNVSFVIRDKDILEKLLIEDNQKYYKINSKGTVKGKFAILFKGFFDIIKQDFKLLMICIKNRPGLMIGTDYSITHIGSLLGIPSLVLNEDDLKINKYFCKLAYPFATHIISPNICDVGKYKYKKIGYDGYQKLAYLHPNYFKPNPEIIKQYFPDNSKYVLLRLVSFNAGHDIESLNSGISEELLINIISLVEGLGYKLYISSEANLPQKFDNHLLKIKHTEIHHLMYYANLFIADSQSMIVESAIIGTPSIRYNSFVGKISVLNELENKYELTNGIHINNIIGFKDKIVQLLSDENYRKNLAKRRDKMLSDKIDLTAFLIWVIKDYPQSVEKIKNNPEYQKEFKYHGTSAL